MSAAAGSAARPATAANSASEAERAQRPAGRPKSAAATSAVRSGRPAAAGSAADTGCRTPIAESRNPGRVCSRPPQPADWGRKQRPVVAAVLVVALVVPVFVAAELVAEPLVELVAELVAEPVAELVAEHVAVLVAELVAEPVAELVAELVVEPGGFVAAIAVEVVVVRIALVVPVVMVVLVVVVSVVPVVGEELAVADVFELGDSVVGDGAVELVVVVQLVAAHLLESSAAYVKLATVEVSASLGHFDRLR